MSGKKSLIAMSIALTVMGSLVWTILWLAILKDPTQSALSPGMDLVYLEGEMWPSKQLDDFDGYYLHLHNLSDAPLQSVEARPRFKTRVDASSYGCCMDGPVRHSISLADVAPKKTDTVFTYKVEIQELRSGEEAWVWFSHKGELNSQWLEGQPTARREVDNNRTKFIVIKGQALPAMSGNPQPSVGDMADYLWAHGRAVGSAVFAWITLLAACWLVIRKSVHRTSGQGKPIERTPATKKQDE